MDTYEALADKTRREIITLLASGERSAGDLSSRFDMAGPSVSRHLKVLRESGLISYRQQAQSRFYQLEPARLEEVRQWAQAQLDLVSARFDRLAAHLDRMKDRGE
ncbi:metalloregulator ArsR/SmtB family transcription factor [Phenylobacterium sp.]|jgi:DNA-binding transcriptional ArsR family regulator|uniref:metalloregulator ArsR/SmtB family transcription factor n=1 Tax=Phenylobacterium sp. TaxID=1871053 RepID=UPI002F422EFA